MNEAALKEEMVGKLCPANMVTRGSTREGHQMPYQALTRDQRFLRDGTSKRILSFDDGGLRGI